MEWLAACGAKRPFIQDLVAEKSYQLPTDKEIVKPRCLASAASCRDRHIESVQRHRNHAIKPDEINELRRSPFAKQVDGLLIR
jgi:hypothetical protein